MQSYQKMIIPLTRGDCKCSGFYFWGWITKNKPDQDLLNLYYLMNSFCRMN